MRKLTTKRKALVKLITVYAFMTLAVVTIVAIISLFVLGFRFNADDGRIEQYAFLQFATSPKNATVTVDGEVVSSKTPNKSTVREGRHNVVMSLDGYQTWSKTVDIKAGTITWLNYVILVPDTNVAESVINYESIYSTLTAPKSRNMLIQLKSDMPTYNLVDISSDAIKTTKIIIPADAYSQSGVVGVVHTFNSYKWDDGGRYVLINHIYGDKNEWLVLDTQDVAVTKNITRLLNVSISSISFSGTSGNDFYALNGSDIRKLDLAAGTLSKALVSNVDSFEVYNSNIITYTGTGANGNRVAGLYREGDINLHILKTALSKDSALHIATANYYNENYIAISDGKKVYITSGNYPNTVAENTTSMKAYATFDSAVNIQNLSFNPTGEYVLVQSGSYFVSFDLENKHFTSSNIDGTGDVSTLKWLDNSNLWSDRGGNLVVRDFDGINGHVINSVVSGQDVTLTANKKYLYSIGKTKTGYQLQRVLMITNS
ncbi:MAG: PEGA domain-containing protein [Candidatus Saccharibacteria bacterium]